MTPGARFGLFRPSVPRGPLLLPITVHQQDQESHQGPPLPPLVSHLLLIPQLVVDPLHMIVGPHPVVDREELRMVRECVGWGRPLGTAQWVLASTENGSSLISTGWGSSGEAVWMPRTARSAVKTNFAACQGPAPKPASERDQTLTGHNVRTIALIQTGAAGRI